VTDIPQGWNAGLNQAVGALRSWAKVEDQAGTKMGRARAKLIRRCAELVGQQRREAHQPPARGCSNCGAVPAIPETGLCGPCTFGESDAREEP
jgi:hypothetical protein